MDESISKYRILKNLDATDEGRVYLAEDPLLGRVVVHLFGADSAERSSDAGHAAQAWLDVNHPNVARVLDVGKHDGRLFVVRPFIEGTPLVEFLRRSQMPSADALSWMRDLASALAYLHRRSIVHGNLSPAGLIVDLAGSIRVVYQPLGRSVGGVVLDADAVRYASPERLTGVTVDAGSDIFVFGAILYEVLTGRPAFPGTDVPQIIRAILNAPPALSYGSPRLNATLVRLVEGCLQGDPRSRYQEIDIVVSGLDVAQRAERIAALVADATAQLAVGKYSEALATCQEALSLDPDHVSARELLRRAGATADSKAGVGQRGKREESVRALDENVQFTVYRRSVVAPERWYPMLAFAHLAERRSEGPADEPDPVAEVHRQAKQVLGQGAADFQQVTQESKRPIPERGQLRFVPDVEGIEFNPLERSFRWTESVHREEFRLRASRALDGRIARGVVSIYLGHMLVAEITLALRVDSQASAAESIADNARPYRRIFASYSHRDTAIVEEFEYHVQSLGDEYLRDVTLLRAGEVWTPRLAEVIASADIFQLFWSWNSLQSPFVRAEWEYALALRRTHYIRPVYWENPFPATIDLPPPSLRALHFKEIRPRAVATDRALPGPTARGDCILLEVTTAQPSEPRRVSRLVFTNEGGTIGRRNDNALILQDSRVSGRHAVISYRDAVFHIEDTSTNGVFINTPRNRLVPGRCYALQSGDRIFIDPYVIDVQVSSRQPDSPTGPEDFGESRTSGRGPLAADPFPVDDPFGPPPAPRRSLAERTSHPDPAEPGPVPSEEVDPLILLGPEPTRTPTEQQAPTMPEVDQTLVLGHYSPPPLHRPPPPAAASPAAGVAIPEDYDPLGYDFIAPPTPPAQPTSSSFDHVPTGEVFVVPEPTGTPPAQAGDPTDLLAGAGLTHISATPLW